MAQFPQNPRIGQTFLPNQTNLYVWSGYQWVPGTGVYGAFQDEQDQTASVDTATPMIYRTTDFAYGVSIKQDESGNLTRISPEHPGRYNVQFSAQLDRVAGSGIVEVSIWFRKNGIDIPWSNTKVTLSGNANASKVVAAWNFFLETQYDSDYIQIMWRTPNSNIRIISDPPNSSQPDPAAYPGIPSIIMTINQVGF
jgi:hypothetical protein